MRPFLRKTYLNLFQISLDISPECLLIPFLFESILLLSYHIIISSKKESASGFPPQSAVALATILPKREGISSLSEENELREQAHTVLCILAEHFCITGNSENFPVMQKNALPRISRPGTERLKSHLNRPVTQPIPPYIIPSTNTLTASATYTYFAMKWNRLPNCFPAP